jgi:hypothetical protein
MFTVHTGSPIAVLLTIRIALLAGLFRTRTKPTLFDRMQSLPGGRGSVVVTIKLLANALPAFSH